MRRLTLALLALLLVPATALGKDLNAPVRVLWNSTHDDVRAHGRWDARLSLLQGPGGFDGTEARPVIVLTDRSGGAVRRIPMSVDISPSTFKATVAFPRAGTYDVAVEGFDPSDPARFADLGAPVRVEPAAPPAAAAGDVGDSWWPWALVAGAAIAALLAGAAVSRKASRSGPRPNASS